MLRLLTWGAVAAAAVTVGCSDSDSIPQASTKSVVLTASAAGAWADASCTVTGARGTTFGPFVTDFPDGVVQATGIPTVDLPALVECVGGRYFDPETAVFQELPTDFSLSGVIPSESVLNSLNDNVAINIFTDGVAEFVRALPVAEQDGTYVLRAANTFVEVVLPGFPGTGFDLLSPPSIVNAAGPQLGTSAADAYAIFLLTLATVDTTKTLDSLLFALNFFRTFYPSLVQNVQSQGGTITVSIDPSFANNIRGFVADANAYAESIGSTFRATVPDSYDGSSTFVINVTGAQGGS